VDRLCADPAKARDELGWEPKIGFEELVEMMVDADLDLLASSGGSAGEEFATDSW
jgi:GDPmannose 4,6-dehydratase